MGCLSHLNDCELLLLQLMGAHHIRPSPGTYNHPKNHHRQQGCLPSRGDHLRTSMRSSHSTMNLCYNWPAGFSHSLCHTICVSAVCGQHWYTCPFPSPCTSHPNLSQRASKVSVQVVVVL